MRSSWKIAPIRLPFCRVKIYEKFRLLSLMRLWTKDFFILPCMFDKEFVVYNGSKFLPLEIKRDMLNSFLGKYILTKRITSVIHKQKKNKKKKTNKNK